MANPIIANLIAEKIAQSSGGDRITDSEVREVMDAMNAFIADDLAYNASIPFTCMNGSMAAHTVTGAIIFTKNTSNAMPWASVGLRLTANGVNIPDFSEFKKSNSSASYVNTLGVVNVILFWFDGVEYWFSIYQEVGLVQLTAPTELVAIATSSSAIDLDWTDNNTDPNEQEFEIQRSLDGIAWTAIGSTPVDENHYGDSLLSPATQYYYRVRAKGDGVETTDSDWSNTADDTTSAGMDADAEAFFAEYGITDILNKTAIDTLVTSIKAISGGDVWNDKIHSLWPANNDQGAGSIYGNLRTPGVNDLVPGGIGSHVLADTGITGGSDLYLSTGINANTLPLDNCGMSFYSRTNSGGQPRMEMGCLDAGNALRLVIKWVSGNTYAEVNNVEGHSGNIISDTSGLFSLHRVDSTGIKIYQNGALVLSNALASTAVCNSIIMVGNVNSGTGLTLTGTAGSDKEFTTTILYKEGLTDAEEAAVYAAVQAYETALSREV